MRGFNETLIVHMIDENENSLFLETFFKWIGVICFSYTYNEIQDKYNKILISSGSRFDAVLYVNDNIGLLQKRFRNLSDANISGKMTETKKEDLKNIFKDVCDNVEEDRVMPEQYHEALKVFEVLVEVYCECGLYDEICNGKRFDFDDCIWSEEDREKVKGRRKIYEKALSMLESSGISDDIFGYEHFEYARLYCRKEMYIFDYVLGGRNITEQDDIIECADVITDKTGHEFTAAENLVSEMYSWRMDGRNVAINVMAENLASYNTGICKGIAKYTLGRMYKDIGRNKMAIECFEDSYKLNPLNYKVLYSLAVNTFERGFKAKAKSEFVEFLTFLQLDTESKRNCQRALKKLSRLELAYAEKCYILLTKIEKSERHKMANNIEYCEKMLEDVRKEKEKFER